MQRFSIHPYYFSWEKRAFDVAISGLILTSGLPFLVGIGFLVWLTQGWPVFFVQKRLGRNRQPFTAYKFRAMYLGAELDQTKYRRQNEAPAPMFKLENDPRFVGIGKLLSHSGLDELPQMWNVLKGEMSLVGPRALPIAEAEKLAKSWDFRYKVRPGILSEWALSSRRFQSLETWRKLELQALKNASFEAELTLIVQYGVFLLIRMTKSLATWLHRG